MSKVQDTGASAFTVLETLATSPRALLRRARRSSDGASVVLKSFHQPETSPQQRAVLETELELLFQLSGPGIPQAHEMHELHGQLVLVLEDFAGQGLPLTPGGLPIESCLTSAVSAARALASVHDAGFVHNDIRPANFLLNRATNELKLVDFQLASRADSESDGSASMDHEASLPYVSPERTGRMNRKPDQRADLYSLGVTLFQIATGQLPFSASDLIGWTHAHLSRQAPLANELRPEIPAVLARAIAKLLAKNPDERYQSCRGLLADLEQMQQSWAASRAIPDFRLGSRDLSRELETSRELVGRDAELESARALLYDAAAGARRLLLISGAAGVGKSSLLAALPARAAEHRAFFLLGSFEQRERNVPYSALSAALRQLIAELLSRPESSLAQYRQRVLAALGQNAGVMCELLPELERVLGRVPSAPAANANETQHRLKHALRELVKVFARDEHPLVLALDDCQRMDASTAEALGALLTAADVRHLLVVLSFRDDALSPEHPLTKLSEAVAGHAQLTLRPLDGAAVTGIVARTLRVGAEEVAPFAQLVREKTDGNPFFIAELLASFERQGVLTLDAEHGRWRWDLERAQSAQVSDNVAALMADRIARLSPAARRALSTAACFDNEFELGAVARALDSEEADTAILLDEAVGERLIRPLPGSGRYGASLLRYAFQHARVRDAAYGALERGERLRVHQRIGERLAKLHGDEPREHLFELLHHQNLARENITTMDGRRALARLNLAAAERASGTAAFDIAEQHAVLACELLGAEERAADPLLAFRAVYARAEAAFIGGHAERAEALSAELFALAPDKLARASAHVLRARIIEHRARLLDAIAEIRAGLALFDVRLPESPQEIDEAVGAGVAKMQAHLARVPVEALAELPDANSRDIELVLSLLLQSVPPAIQTYPPLFLLVELMMFDIALTQGVTVVSCKNFVDCGIIQAAVVGDHDVAYRLGKAAFKLLERYRPTPLECAVNFVFGGFVSHWKAHYREGSAAYDAAEQRGLELGDVQHVAYTWAHRTQRSYLVGRPLQECREELDAAIAFLTRVNGAGQRIGTLAAERALARLTASDAEPSATQQADDAATAQVLGSQNAQWAYSYGQAQTLVSFLLGDLCAAKRWLEFTQPYTLAAASLFSLPDHHLVAGLIAARGFVAADEQEQKELRAAIAEHLGKLKVWAQAAPANYAHKYHLLRAEQARIAGQPLELVLGAYREAIESAGNGFGHLRALTNELEAELWLDLGDARHARPALEAAYRLYAEWGATQKLRLLERRHPAWFAAGTARDSAHGNAGLRAQGDALDASSIVKATQSISSEVETRKLFAALMATLIENAGAQHGCLVLRDEAEQQYYVRARADVEAPQEGAFEAQPLEHASGVCAAAVRYVLRSSEALALDDAAAAGPFQSDPYVQARRVRSLLCLPIQQQGQVIGALYLENNCVSHAFTRERLAILQVIASQAAISITNAQLYARLEERVKERTQELAKKNRQIASMLDNMDQGVFTIDRDLAVQPEYSRRLEQILGSDAIAGRNCMELLFAGSNLRPDQLTSGEAALRFSFGVEPWMAAVNASHLIKEFRRSQDGEERHFEVDWNTICDDDGFVDRVLVVVRDVTLVRRLRRAATEKAREADIVAQVLESGLDAFQDFCAVAKEVLEQNRHSLAELGAPSRELLAATLRGLHTLKGNARLLALTHLVDALHAAEQVCEELRQEASEVLNVSALLAELEAVAELVAQYEDVCARKLAPLARRGDQRVERSLREISALVAEADASHGPARLVRNIRAALERLEGVALSELIRDTSRIVPSLAVELGRSVPQIDAGQADVLLSKPWAQPLRDVLVQCFRNSLYHGIEARDERVASGKTPQGQIRITSALLGDGLELQVCDDGRGLALQLLRQRTNGSALDDEGVAEHIFTSGVSTAREVSQVAGRGVGLDVVRALLRERGGDVHVRFSGPERGGYRPFALVLRLPRAALADGRSTSLRPSRPPAAAE